MATTATYIVTNPTPGTLYYAPSAYWIKANAGTTVTCQVNTYNSSGTLLSVASLEAIVHDASISTNVNTYTANNVYGVSCAITANGTDIYQPGGMCTGSPASLRMYFTYTGTIYDQPPNTPTNLTPANGAMVTTLTPTITANFSDPTGGDTLYQYQLQVTYVAGAQIWDSGVVNASSGEIAAGQLSKVYNGSTALVFGTSYEVRCKVANQNGLWSGWTAFNTFSVAQGPSAPTSVTPTGQVASLTPPFSFVYSSASSVNQATYRYIIKAASGGATIYDSGNISSSVTSGSTVNGTVSGGANLQNGQAYTFNISCIDANGASSPTTTTSFNVAQVPQVALTSPINSVTVNTQTPTFTWNFTDPNYAQATYRVMIYNVAGGGLIKDTGAVASAATSYTLSGTTIAFGTNIRWRMVVTDTAGFASSYTSYAYATVNSAPTATVTAPSNGAVIATNTPTIVWTYGPPPGGSAQATATILINDSNGNQLASYVQAGTGTSFPIPLGLLQGGKTYQVQVVVTAVNASVGYSGITSFSLVLVAPADMQGNSGAVGHNYVISPHLNSDANSDGVADGWTLASSANGQTQVVQIDGNVIDTLLMPSGDGPFTGAQNLQITAIPGTPSNTQVWIYQEISIATPGWTANSTHVSARVKCIMERDAGSPSATLALAFYNGGSLLSTLTSANQGSTAGAIAVLLGPQNALIPSGCTKIRILLQLTCPTHTDLGQVWFLNAQLEAAAASQTTLIAGDLGTGYSYDSHGYAVGVLVAGNSPTVVANPGADTDPISASGGTMTLGWDTTLADGRFLYYLIDRRRMDQQTDDTAWNTLATITNPTQSSFTDYTPGGNLTYQYGIRQAITYTDGSVGVSANRALVAGSVNYAPAWYLVNTQGVIYNMRFTTLDTKRKNALKERAVYSAFLGRIGLARDAGPIQGYEFDLIAYFNDTWGDVRPIIRRQLYQMQSLNVVWYLKDPEGLVVPVHFEEFDMDETDTDSDTLLAVTLKFAQAAATDDY